MSFSKLVKSLCKARADITVQAVRDLASAATSNEASLIEDADTVVTKKTKNVKHVEYVFTCFVKGSRYCGENEHYEKKTEKEQKNTYSYEKESPLESSATIIVVVWIHLKWMHQAYLEEQIYEAVETW
ncbi:hypothetical protein CEXT_783691 [Caerostris extrusa]|uniref:Uncharacterized protein n=1 Tax=Caerostris extrusa TaxID=172846 RepID=A0AAV4NX18_CAEEX|nr:hypothetical protein CEXT_783691 [Caerostris extrusa]